MANENSKTLFEVDGQPVVFWHDYGPTCKIWTTNGSIGYVAKYTAQYATIPGRITNSTLDVDMTDESQVREALKTAYQSYMKESK